MVKQVLKFNLISNEIVEIKFGQTLGKIEKFDTSINLSKGSTLVSASLSLTADQTYLSGASLQVTMNRSNLNPPLRWNAFENVRRSQDYNVSALIVAGLNTFSVLYSAAFGVLGDQRANVNLDLVVTLEVPDASVPGAKVPPAKEDVNWTQKLWDGLSGAKNLVIGVTIVLSLIHI